MAQKSRKSLKKNESKQSSYLYGIIDLIQIYYELDLKPPPPLFLQEHILREPDDYRNFSNRDAGNLTKFVIASNGTENRLNSVLRKKKSNKR